MTIRDKIANLENALLDNEWIYWCRLMEELWMHTYSIEDYFWIKDQVKNLIEIWSINSEIVSDKLLN